ncbi:MAG: hypothetical protein WAO12_08675, partial [Venatoribacter sp.]
MEKHESLASLPAQWQPLLQNESADVLAALQRAWQALFQQPMQAAQTAEALFHQLNTNQPATWLAFAIALCARIQTLSNFCSLDSLLSAYENERQQLDLPPAILSELDVFYFGALVFRNPGHPNIATLSQQVLDTFEQEGSPLLRLTAANYLLLYRIWKGDLLGADALGARVLALRETAEDTRTNLLSHSIMAMLKRLFLEYKASHNEIAAGLALSEQTGLHYWDSHFHMQAAFLALTKGNLDEANEWLNAMEQSAPPEHYLDRSGYHYSRTWQYILADEAERALRHAQEAVHLAELSGAIFPQAVTHLGLAQLYLEKRKLGRAIFHISHARKVGKAMDSHYVPFARGLARAHIAQKLGMSKRCELILASTFKLGREQHYLNYPWWRGDIMAKLCAQALAANIEPEYTKMLIQKRRLQPPKGETKHWHWPLVVHILDGGTITLDDQPVVLNGKIRELFFSLAALGNADLPISRNTLQDQLWPDSQGDLAKQALDTSIHRLRKLLGTENLILSLPNGLMLNPNMVRVDYWDLLIELGKAKHNDAEIQTLLHFLQQLNQDDNSWQLPKDSLIRRISHKVLLR